MLKKRVTGTKPMSATQSSSFVTSFKSKFISLAKEGFETILPH